VVSDDRPRVGIIHATPAAMEPVRAAFAARLPGVVALNFLDEGLLDGLNQAGRITAALIRRLATVIGQADAAGVRVILTTCSAYSPVMDTLRPLAAAPIITIDGLLFEESVKTASRLGVLATSDNSLRTTLAGLEAEAARQGRRVAFITETAAPAFAALLTDDMATAAEHVGAAARRLAAGGADTIAIAQASLSRTLPLIGEIGVPVFTSPTLAVSRVARELGLDERNEE
jgi:Asp/Glu/hydantoin racemase